MQRFYFALFFVVGLVAQMSSANWFHEVLKAKDFNLQEFVNCVEELGNPKATLSELDEDDLTVFGRAIIERRQEAIEYLLEKECDDIGPSGKGKALAAFSMQAHSPDIYVFLFNYEIARQSYSIGTSIKVGREKLSQFLKLVEPPTSSSTTCKVMEPFRWPPRYGNGPEILHRLNRVIEETCGSASRSEGHL